MSHAFDSNLTDALRTLLANAVKAKLTPLLVQGKGGEAGGFLEAIEVIGFGIAGAHDGHKLDMLWDRFQGNTPAVAIFPGALKPKQAGGPGKSRGPISLELYYVTTHRRDATDGRATMDAIAAGDDSADPGVFAMIELCWARLFDASLGLGGQFSELKLEDEDEIETTLEYTVWKQVYSVDVSRDANMYRGLTQKLTTLHTTLKQSQPTDEPVGKRIVEDTTVG